jgi:AraC-like DNA-binding protein
MVAIQLETDTHLVKHLQDLQSQVPSVIINSIVPDDQKSKAQMSLSKPPALKTIPQHCLDHVLLIPESLHQMTDARAILSHQRAGIFHKYIQQDMVGIEFFTNSACLAYVVQGIETFHGPDGEAFRLSAGEMLLMPRNTYMVSDFLRQDGPLEAYLFFFDNRVASRFIKRSSRADRHDAEDHAPVKLLPNEAISQLVRSLDPIYSKLSAKQELVELKLLEALHLLSLSETEESLKRFLAFEQTDRPRRNIKQVMRDFPAHNLSIADFAELSGRSLSTFQRDFKRQFGQAPSQWFREARLQHAAELLRTSEETITSISMTVGYSDSSHIIKVFKNRFGKTPKQLRKEIKDENQKIFLT